MSESVRFIIERQTILPENTQEANPAVNAVVNACLKETFGDTALLNPNTIIVQPVLGESMYAYSLHSWHELGSSPKTGRMQYLESIFGMSEDQVGPYLITESDETIRISQEEKRCLAAVYWTGVVGALIRKVLPPNDFLN